MSFQQAIECRNWCQGQILNVCCCFYFINHDRVLHFGAPTSYVAALSLLSLGILYKFDSILITNEMTTKEKTKI